MKCSEIITLLEQEYGKEYACDWDNVGLLAGRRDKEVRKFCWHWMPRMKW